jgi:hypothetical protein
VSGEVVKGEGWEECTTSSVREPHSAVSKYGRRNNVFLSLEIHVQLVCRTLKNDTNVAQYSRRIVFVLSTTLTP